MTALNDTTLPAYGYSWAKSPPPDKDDPRDPRVRVCPNRRRPGDPINVRIVSLPDRPEHRPKCVRCGCRLGNVRPSYA